MILILVTTCLLIQCVSAKNILVFGGNGFLGSEVVYDLILKGHDVTIVNRGTPYWDFESRIKPLVNHIICDRYTGLKHCSSFVSFIQNVKFDFVIDFSCYHSKVLGDSLSLLTGKTDLYIFISTDSVYEVCVTKTPATESSEDDAVRPTNEEERSNLNSKDSYGHRKLACEELLNKQRSEGGIPFVILRLPDVIGPRDNTHRWWMYQLWIQYHNITGIPIYVPQKVLRTLSSMVYVGDVSKVIIHILHKVDSKESNNIVDGVFNLGFNENFNLKKILYKIQTLLGINGVEYQYPSSEDAFHLYPSVYRGPVNITKAQKYLDWNPTPWDVVAKTNVEFYKQAFYTFEQERNEVLQKLETYAVAPSHIDIFQQTTRKDIEKHSHHENNCFQEKTVNSHEEL
ncbi:chloroplast stem-loop binding protein of 41 kDa b, chloroplastic-like [Centruroides sculpturatus]|uniref:chloroplast stem-loop binding protein of 41 kDa b, chloroplastic-like n=1 Tax=Centruroides sculpturatus TaxID=218467 RepID=UPI000C6C97E3|nr:chloroplast stem-loop binding protein of 41 kDa b, chloroplastic-like [Centruroides sculpturatus]